MKRFLEGKAKFVFALLLTFMFYNAAAEDRKEPDKVIVHFDSSGYYPGEYVWFKAYVPPEEKNPEQRKEGAIQPPLHIELIDPFGNMVESMRFLVFRNATAGGISLKEEFIEGIYTFIAYTRPNRSDAFVAYIPLFNKDGNEPAGHCPTLTVWRNSEEADISTTQSITTLPFPERTSSLSYEVCATDIPGRLMVKVCGGRAHQWFSISALNKKGARADKQIKGAAIFFSGEDTIKTESNTGFIVSGRLRLLKKKGNDLSGCSLRASVFYNGDIEHEYYTSLDKDGRFSFETPFFLGRRKLSCLVTRGKKQIKGFMRLNHVCPPNISVSQPSELFADCFIKYKKPEERSKYYFNLEDVAEQHFLKGEKFPYIGKWLVDQEPFKSEFYKKHRGIGWDDFSYSLSPEQTIRYDDIRMRRHSLHTNDIGSHISEGSSASGYNTSTIARSWPTEGAPRLRIDKFHEMYVDLTFHEDRIPSKKRKQLSKYKPFSVHLKGKPLSGYENEEHFLIDGFETPLSFQNRETGRSRTVHWEPYVQCNEKGEAEIIIDTCLSSADIICHVLTSPYEE